MGEIIACGQQGNQHLSWDWQLRFFWLSGSPLNLECSGPEEFCVCVKTPEQDHQPRHSMRIRDQIIKDSLLSNFLSFKEVTQVMHCLWEARPQGGILISAGIFHCTARLSPSVENTWRPHLKQCLEQTREKERKEMGKEKRRVSYRGGKKAFQKKNYGITNYWTLTLCKELFKYFLTRTLCGRHLISIYGCEN